MTQETVPAEKLQELIALFAQGRFLEVSTRATDLIAQYPRGHQLFNILGAADDKLGHTEKALAAYHRSIEMKPDYAEAHSNMGATLFGLGRYSEAVDSLQKALEINPNHVPA